MMLARLFPAFDYLRWQSWFMPALGLVLTSLAFVVVRQRRERQRVAALSCSTAETEAELTHSPWAGLANLRRSPPPPERRLSLRRPGNPVRVQVVGVDASQKPWEAWVVDRSSGGLRLAVPKPVAVGARLQVRTMHDPACSPWVQLCVRGCWQREDLWVVGCQFVRLPPMNVLLLFG